MQLPLQLHQALERELEKVPSSELARASAELTVAYRTPDKAKPPLINSEARRLAYAAVRMPATYAAAHEVLSELKQRHSEVQISSVLDVGAGPGTTTWAVSQLFPEIKQAMLAEQETGLIELGRKLATNATLPFNLKWVQQDVLHLDAGRHDLVVLSYVIGELAPGDLPNLIERTWNITAGALVIIEPGTPLGYGRIIGVRDVLINAGANLVAPCPHMRECPMLHTRGEWCHFAARVERTSIHRRIKSGTLGHEDEKFSYVIFSRNPISHVDARIVRHPLKHTGHVELQLCAQEGLKAETVSRKHKDLYHAAREAKWGEAWPPYSSVMQPFDQSDTTEQR
jgi:ribosomal protein RSM22 (predicted rRNA methylase)